MKICFSEHLTFSVRSSNALLTWPSTTVQYGLPLIPRLDGGLHMLGQSSGQETCLCIPNKTELELFGQTCTDLLMNTSHFDADTLQR